MQIVGYDAGVGELAYDPVEGVSGLRHPPALLVAADGAVREERLEPGRELDYGLVRRHCAGSRDGDDHDPCESGEAPYCPEHSSSWPCARCSGNCGLPIEACREEHAVYLAAFAPDVVKVGVTRLWRLAARLREQGADRAAHVHTVSDGRIARRIENEIAESVPDRVAVESKVAGLGRRIDEGVWGSRLAEFPTIETFEFEYGLDLTARPVAETLASGTVVGSKGRLVVLERAGSTYAVDLRDLVGYEVDPDGGDRDRQSSLGAFG